MDVGGGIPPPLHGHWRGYSNVGFRNKSFVLFKTDEVVELQSCDTFWDNLDQFLKSVVFNGNRLSYYYPQEYVVGQFIRWLFIWIGIPTTHCTWRMKRLDSTVVHSSTAISSTDGLRLKIDLWMHRCIARMYSLDGKIDEILRAPSSFFSSSFFILPPSLYACIFVRLASYFLQLKEKY